MTIKTLDVTLEEFSAESAFLTSDGKTIKVRDFICDGPDRVSIEDAGIGTKLRLRDGRTGVINRTSDSPGGDKRVRLDYSGNTLWFYDSGQCNLYNLELDVVEIIELKHLKPRVSLEGLKIGDKVRLRSGSVLIYNGKRGTRGNYWLVGEHGCGLYYLPNGNCNLGGSEREAVEIIPRTVVDCIREQLKKLDANDISHVILARSVWGPLTFSVIDGVPLVPDENISPDGFTIVFKRAGS